VEPLWEPSPERAAGANLTRFQDFLRETRGLCFADYDELWRWSVTDLEGFWAAVWAFFELDRVSGYDQVLADDSMPGARWFTGAEVNFAGYLLDQGAPDAVAVTGVDEAGNVSQLSREELRGQVAALAATLTRLGVGLKDVVVGYLPNIEEAVVAYLATASLGATWSSVGQDYAPSAVVDRFGQLRPKVLFTCDGYRFNGRRHSRLEAIGELRRGLPTLEHVVLVRRLTTDSDSLLDADSSPDADTLGGPAGDVLPWSAAVAGSAELAPVPVSFDHPMWVLFSSGTTGIPKGLVHGHGGFLVETLKQLGLHWDVRAGDRVFWYTSPSWVMWNLQVSALATGAGIVCYDGSPTYPDPSTLWRLVAEHGVTFFGTSPGYLQASQNAGVRPGTDFDPSRLRAMGSTGSPLAPYLHSWARHQLGDVPLWSMSGGTDIAGAFVGGAPTVPIWPGEISVRCLGVALESWNEQGKPVYDEVGELVVHRPMPSMPVHLYDDPDGGRYREAYFSTFPGAWRQGDWITITGRGSVVIHGRSDSTLNRHGVRMGSADIYAAVETIPEVVEALVIGAEQSDGGYWMPLFVVLEEGIALDDALAERIRSAIREKASPRHVPDEVVAVPGIPHTRTGKKLEVPVKRILQGAPVERVANPDAVDDAGLLAPFADLARARAGGRSRTARPTEGAAHRTGWVSPTS
jgi:acetoacetyl-CoA synthetase